MARGLMDAIRGGAKSALDGLKSTSLEVTRKTRVGDLRQQFDDAFHLTLRVYHGAAFAADGKTVGEVSASKRKLAKHEDDVTIRASMTAEEVRGLFEDHFGIKARVADQDDDKLIPDHVTLGDAHRGEYKPRKR